MHSEETHRAMPQFPQCPFMDRGLRPDGRRLLPLPACFHSQDAEAAVVVVEGDPLDQTGDFLGSGSAFRDCGIHRGFHFRMGGLQHADESR